MSMPHLYLKCDACSEEWALGTLVGRTSYQLPNGQLVKMGKTMAWCTSCKSYSPVEKLITREAVEKELSFLQDEYQLAKRLTKFNILAILGLVIDFDRKKLKSIKKEVKCTRKILDFLAIRKAPSKCLNCGSTEISFKSAFEEPEFHPNCGGEIKRHESKDLRIIYRLQHKIYNWEGKFIRVEEK